MERISFEFDASFALLLWFGLLISFMRKRSYVFFSFCFYGYNIVTKTDSLNVYDLVHLKEKCLRNCKTCDYEKVLQGLFLGSYREQIFNANL